MENTFFYTLSTIPQVLAAIVAFSSTIAIVRLGAFNSNLRSIIDELINSLDPYKTNSSKQAMSFNIFRNKLTKLSRQDNINELEMEINKFDSGLSKKIGIYNDILDAYNTKYKDRMQYLSSFKNYLIFGGVLTIVSLFLLPFSEQLACFKYFGYCILIVFTFTTSLYTLLFILFLSRSLTKL